MNLAPVGLEHFLVLSAALFCLGIVCLLTRRTAIGILMGIELVINAGNINLIAFAHYRGNDPAGQVFALIAIVMAAIEAFTTLAILFALYRTMDRRINIEEASILRG